MKYRLLVIEAFFLLVTQTSLAQPQIFKPAKLGSASTFTGTVWVTPLMPDDSIFHCVVGNVQFEPGARSFWHMHTAGQVVLVIDGAGYTQERGKPIRALKAGDVIICKPGVEHWHGASPRSSMTHISINPNTENGIVTWLGPVTDAEYPKQ